MKSQIFKRRKIFSTKIIWEKDTGEFSTGEYSSGEFFSGEFTVVVMRRHFPRGNLTRGNFPRGSKSKNLGSDKGIGVKDRLQFYEKRQVFESNVYQLKILISVHNKDATETFLELHQLLQYKLYIERFLFCFQMTHC